MREFRLNHLTLPQLFRFVQFELAGRVGPAPGRYVVRRYAGADADHILVVGGHEAERRWLPARRRPRPAAPGSAVESVPVTRVTVIDAEALPDEAAAARWLADEAAAAVEPAGALLNRLFAAHRVAAADPYAGGVRPDGPLVVRAGFGPGEDVAEGHWTEAVVFAPPRPERTMLAPQERVAALMGARDVALACEELALRAELDVQAGRRREAALQLRSALEAAVVELRSYSELSGMTERLGELGELKVRVDDVARAAAEGGLDDEQLAVVEEALGRLRGALRARLAATGM